MKSTMLKITAILASVAGLSYVSTATAARTDFLPAWTQVASDCNVSEAYSNHFATSLNELTFKTGSLSSWIVARCNVSSPNGLNPSTNAYNGWTGYNTLWVGYQDPDGTATNYQTYVRLLSENRYTGASSFIAAFNSNTSSVTTRTEGYSLFTHTWNFLSNNYYVEIWLYRGANYVNTGVVPKIGHVRLSYSVQTPA